MWNMVPSLHRFYATKQGMLLQRVITEKLETLWAPKKSFAMGGYGYALPYLESYQRSQNLLVALMPAPMGVCPWPEKKHNLTVLTPLNCLPLKDQSLDRLLVIHAFESLPNTRGFLREAWRVLKDDGEIIVVAPNRRGLWAQVTTTPLGHGHPYTGHQLYGLLEAHFFQPEKPVYALYQPPLEKPSLSLYQTWESWGERFYKKFGGCVLIKAQKQKNLALTPPDYGWVRRIFIPKSQESS